MRFFNILALATSVSAAATGLDARKSEAKKCLCKADVDYLVDAYKSILTKWEPKKADFIADKGFFDYSDSINTVAGLQTGFPIFPNKTAFVGYQSTTPDNIPVVIVEVGPWNCNQVAFIWTATFAKDGGEPLPARGITILEGAFDKESKKWQIQNIKVEFNSINYYRNTGGECVRPQLPQVTKA